jgi:hypothetical protein
MDTISVQRVYLAWDNAIYAHTTAMLHIPQDVDWQTSGGVVQV